MGASALQTSLRRWVTEFADRDIHDLRERARDQIAHRSRPSESLESMLHIFKQVKKDGLKTQQDPRSMLWWIIVTAVLTAAVSKALDIFWIYRNSIANTVSCVVAHAWQHCVK